MHSPSSNNQVDSDGILSIPTGKTLYLCLNGHSLKNSKQSSNVIDIQEGGRLILSDCRDSGWIGGRTSGSNAGSIWVKGNFSFYGGSLKNNKGVNNGGGIFALSKGQVTMYGGSIEDNEVIHQGGGVFLNDSSTFTMYGGTIQNNSSPDIGGGVQVSSSGNNQAAFIQQGGTIQNNITGISGGGVAVSGGKYTLKDGVLSNNRAGANGGGVYVTSYGSFTMEEGTLEKNTAQGSGGGIFSWMGTTTSIQGGNILENEARFYGGGIALYGIGNQRNADSSFQISGGEVKQSRERRGGIYQYEYSKITIDGTKDIHIQENQKGQGLPSNLYLTNSSSKYPLEIKAITETSSIGVTSHRKAEKNKPWVFSTANEEADYSSCFFSDEEDYLVQYNQNKKLELTKDFQTFILQYDCSKSDVEIPSTVLKTFASQDEVTLSTTIPTYLCHTFLGWAETEDAEDALYQPGDTLILTENKTLYPVYQESHDLRHVDAKPKTCLQDGNLAYYECETCHRCFEDDKAVKEILDKESLILKHSPTDHVFTEWIEEVEPTEEKDGVKGHKDCIYCHRHFDNNNEEIEDLTLYKPIPMDDNRPGKSSGCKGSVVALSTLLGTVAFFSFALFFKAKKEDNHPII